MTLEEQIDEITKQIEVLQDNLRNLQISKQRQDSIAFIKANHITMADVELSDAPKHQWYGHIDTFSTHLRALGSRRKRFCEWNGILHWTNDVVDGCFRPTHARLEDVKETPQ